MDPWHLIIWGATCAGGAMIFLKLVADGVEVASAALAQTEVRERKAHEKRGGQDADPVAVGVVAA
jgi:hypothetical protein